ncbi:hypothetical protein GCM10007205_23970 [Oxalicibacterium flavum]|uniref:Uncharacterized protein n=1 Tax=Oxalicibacterium flavum TaxID=179467 RepID=A0A8J2UM16_9BURK|nr:hypothetical protein GCM10007205_23970 [Oxalicibacterium flavum]
MGGAPEWYDTLRRKWFVTADACGAEASGVQYGRLVDIGRHVVEQRVPRTPGQRILRYMLKETLTRGALFGPALRLGRAVGSLLPAALRALT